MGMQSRPDTISVCYALGHVLVWISICLRLYGQSYYENLYLYSEFESPVNMFDGNKSMEYYFVLCTVNYVKLCIVKGSLLKFLQAKTTNQPTNESVLPFEFLK